MVNKYTAWVEKDREGCSLSFYHLEVVIEDEVFKDVGIGGKRNLKVFQHLN